MGNLLVLDSAALSSNFSLGLVTILLLGEALSNHWLNGSFGCSPGVISCYHIFQFGTYYIRLWPFFKKKVKKQIIYPQMAQIDADFLTGLPDI
jgi:hypothetical protein